MIYVSSVVLLFLSTYSLFFRNKLKYQENVIFLIILFIFFSVIALRTSGIDYESYSYIYEIQSFEYFSFPLYNTPTLGTTGNEFIFATAISIFKSLNLSFQSFLIFIGVLSLGIKFYFIRKYSDFIVLSCLLYFATLFVKDIGQIRHGLAIAIILFAILPLVKRQAIYYFLVVVLASSIQVFSIVALPLYFLYPYLKNKKIAYLVILTSLIVYATGGIFDSLMPIVKLFSLSIEQKVYGYYENKELDIVYLNIFNISMLLFSLILVYFKEKLSKNNLFFEGLIVSNIYAISCYFFFADLGIISGRIFELLGLYAVIFIMPTFIKMVKPKIVPIMIILLFSSLLSYKLYFQIAYSSILNNLL